MDKESLAKEILEQAHAGASVSNIMSLLDDYTPPPDTVGEKTLDGFMLFVWDQAKHGAKTFKEFKKAYKDRIAAPLSASSATIAALTEKLRIIQNQIDIWLETDADEGGYHAKVVELTEKLRKAEAAAQEQVKRFGELAKELILCGERIQPDDRWADANQEVLTRQFEVTEQLKAALKQTIKEK